jgi:hypothetical protein
MFDEFNVTLLEKSVVFIVISVAVFAVVVCVRLLENAPYGTRKLAVVTVVFDDNWLIKLSIWEKYKRKTLLS